ncbi:hypothetical protein HYPSUDRAFT_210289 [Hypholoma sublateritium FD-334 SS-4]|uniref:Uncharacterized protein n=1 Tax=Hypholoma sublateritium (strain FD-334 SS-4) TaxID=945553 RepID=A0A0D2LPD1_HYPSF|nr:hypothetical protein HYPSUDRAFT_210289 [Hypholoma sublateritium FD-334 SS-4]
MHIGLCDDDFYYLIQIHSERMSYEERIAYREKLTIPRTIDEWIAYGKTRTRAPTANPHKRELQINKVLAGHLLTV